MFPEIESLDAIEPANQKFFEPTEAGKFKFNQAKYDAAIKGPLVAKRDELLGKVAKYKDYDDADLARIAKLKANGQKLTAFDEWVDAQDDDPADPGKGGTVDEKTIRAAVKVEVKRIQDAHGLTLAQKEAEIAKLKGDFENKLLTDELSQLADAHGVIGKRKATWMKEALERFRREDGELVYLENGKPSVEITPEKAVRDVMFKDFDYLYEAREAGGGGGKGGKPASSGRSGAVSLTRQQAKDPAQYRAAKARAEKNGVELTISD